MGAEIHNTPDEEHFALQPRHPSGYTIPSQYVKITLLRAEAVAFCRRTRFCCAHCAHVPGRQPRFTPCLWHVRLHGDTHPSTVAQCAATYQAAVERQALRMCLKHLRMSGYQQALSALMAESAEELEQSKAKELCEALV